ncbi:MAG: hypothetical protein WC554_06460 [Clostridia bacterium]
MSSKTKVILDSGAFTVWSKGTKIDVDEYIKFCQKNSWITYYVNLDVIPGSFGVVAKPKQIQASCEEGWSNYLKMLKKLPIEKVIPVFHQGDDPTWLKKMIDIGAKYVGISPANDRTVGGKLAWMRGTVKPIVIDKSGEPIVGMHGFAVTSLRLMKEWKWKSVDSASWVRVGGMGSVILPRRKNGEYNYASKAHIISVTERGGSVEENGFFKDFKPSYIGSNHYTRLSPTLRVEFDEYLASNGVGLGEWDLVTVSDDYKKDVRKDRWFNKKKNIVFRIKKPGVATSHICRKWLNAKYYVELQNHVPVEDLYLAGMVGVTCYKIEKMIPNRLLSYHFIEGSKENKKIFQYFKEKLSEGQ